MSDNSPTPDPTPAEGRAVNGQFAPGNAYGRGNPFARQVAALRKKLAMCLTEQDIENFVNALRLKANGGDLAAIKLLFDYVIGKPRPALDPDTLDADELRAWQANSLAPESAGPLMSSLPLAPVLEIMPIYKDCQGRTLTQTLTGQLLDLDERERRRAERAETKAERKRRRREERRARQNAEAAPSPTGSNGQAPPSPTASNGKPPPSFFQRWLQGEP
jgi:hypothetical protein